MNVWFWVRKKKTKANEMRTFKWMRGMTRLDNVKNECMTGSLGVTNITGK